MCRGYVGWPLCATAASSSPGNGSPPAAGCDLPRLDPLRFLERHRNTIIGFVGDSLNQNMFVSLVCMLRGASGEVRKWRPAGADWGFKFLRYNLTLAYHRTNLLVHYGGQPVEIETLWNLLDTSKATELMLIFQTKRGQRHQASMMFLFSTQGIGMQTSTIKLMTIKSTIFHLDAQLYM
ncbi:hypothetical protein GUJ93_ZPchr0007g3831 [Zizania palustris]|uniref:Trichome birefringence-like C-terminal domain-containing protein n=1 Tax=Zizania palustris TaxID=103762 RepID=A0A8J5T9B0_ZIZPA|nr:hypothetical protein GUJ93_ZPchr0007g3831 [Zizania palustris]